MPRQLEPPDSTRFYARPRSFAMECPRCGRLDEYLGAPKGRRGGGVDRKPQQRKFPSGQSRSVPGYDPLTGRWCCTGCRPVCLIGILAWPLYRGSGPGRGEVSRPRDQVPSERELAQMRAAGGGQWMPTKLARKRADGSNITAACCCLAESAVADPTCLLHGAGQEAWDRQAAEAAEAEARRMAEPLPDGWYDWCDEDRDYPW